MKKVIPIIILATLAFCNVFAQKTWTGATSKAWNVASNWNPAGVPAASDNVVIPSTPTNQPEINGITSAVCNNLVINAGASLTLAATSSSDANLTLGGNANFYGTFIIKGYFSLVPPTTRYATLTVSDMNWHSGSSITTTLYSTIQVSGNWSFFSGSAVDMNVCHVNFTGAANSNINSYSANSRFSTLAISKTGGAQLIINASSTATLGIDGTLTVGSGAVLTGSAAITTILKGNLINTGNFYFNAGTVSLERASATQTIQVNSGNYFNNLTINAGETVTVNNNLEVKGNLLIQAGVFDPQNYTLSVGGNWTNNVGTAAFTEGTGRVIFNGGNYHQYSSNEIFFTLEVNKPSGGALRMNGTSVTCARYDWTAGAVDVLSNGTFTANQLLDNGIAGNFYINTGCTINLYNYTGNVDLKGNLYIYGGNFKVYGGINPSWWPSGGNASITMSGGVLDFVDQSIVVKTDATYTFSQNITAGTIRTSKNFSNGRSDFTPAAGTVELYGSTASYLLFTAGNLFSLRIDKTTGIIVSVDSDLTINGLLTVNNGTMKVNNKVLTTSESITINSGGNLWLDLNSQLKINSGKILTVNTGGWLKAIGSPGNECVITRSGATGYYNINVLNGGSIAANRASFHYVNPLRVYPGATVDEGNPFSYCKFRYCSTGMLRIDNSQNLLLRNVEFLTPAAGYNAYKAANSGSLNFKDATGDFSGSAFESDPYNLIDWTVSQPGLWTGVANNDWNDPANWDDLALPISSTDVVIPASAPNMPLVNSDMAILVNSLTVHGTLTLKNANLLTQNNCTISGALVMNPIISEYGALQVSGQLIFESGSTANLTANSDISVHKSLVFNAGSNIQILNGRIILVGSFISQVVNHSTNTLIEKMVVAKDEDLYARFSDVSTQHINVNYLEIWSGSFLTAGDKYFTLLKDLDNSGGHISCTGGVFKLDGIDQTLKLRQDDYFHHLVFSQTGTASLNTVNTSVLTVKGNLHIDSGVFDATNLTIKIAGNWDNNVGPASFTETGSRVIFNGGNYHQYLLNNETFNILELDKPLGGALRMNSGTTGYTLTCNVYDWTAGAIDVINGGVFTAYSLYDYSIKGNYYINPGCEINLYPDPSYYGSIGNLYIYGGTFNIYGNGTCLLGFFGGGSIVMSDGVLDFHDISLINYSTYNYDFTLSITGGTIRTKGEFLFWEPENAYFNGGNLEFYGPNTSSVMTFYFDLYNLIINKSFANSEVICHYTSVKNNVIIQKGILLQESPINCYGNFEIYGGGELECINNYPIRLNDQSSLNVYENGVLSLTPALFVKGISSSDYYNINAYAGSIIRVSNTIFENLMGQGFYIAPGAYVDPEYSFNGCSFKKGKTGLNAYLTIDNDQDIVIRNAFFDENTSGVLHNVAKTVDAGSVTFKDASGAFAGEAYESDPYNRIHWVASQPGLWTGALSTNWHDPGNWDDLQVPYADIDVTIPATAPFMPVISAEDTECNSLLLYGTLTIGNKTLYVNGQANIHGNLALNHNDGVLKAMSDIYWHDGSTATISGNATIEAWAGWFFLEGSNVQLNNGVVRFYGTSYNPISIESPDSYFNMLFIQRTDGGGLAFSNSSTADLKAVLLIVLEGSTFASHTSQNVVVSGVYNTAGTTQLLTGSLVFIGNDVSWVPGANSFEFNVVFNQAGNVTINTANSDVLDIRGSVTINSGIFMPGNCTIKVGGHWNNNVGPAAFDEGTSRVIFNGTVPQTVRNEEFYILELDKNPGMPFSIGNGTVVSCQVYDWTNGRLNTQAGATFNAYDLADDGVYGLFSTGSSGTINLYQDENQSVNIIGALTINGGTFNIYGGNEQCGMGYTGNTELNLTSGVLDIKDQSIYIIDNYPYVFSGNIIGGTIRSSKGFTAQSPGFVPDGGTVEVYGEGIGFLFAELGASFYNVKINKPYSYYNTPHHITILTSLIRNDFTIESGSVRLLSDKVLYCLGDVTVKDGGVMQISSADLLMKNEKNLLIEAGGILGISGQPDRYAKIAGFTTEDYYAFNVAGELSCIYGWISQINEQGIYISPGGTMSAYYLELLDGEPGSNPLITVNSENMMTLRAVNFPANNWGGQYNVRKINDAGMVFMLDATGPFSGEAYEYDPYNRINWMLHTNNTEPQTVGDGITICEDAFSFLNVAGLVVETGGSVDLIASVRIRILPGTHIKSGGKLHAWITQTFEFCEQQQSMLASTEIAESEPLQDNYSLPELAPDNQQLSIYPNPTRGIFAIALSGFEDSGVVMIQIFGMRGQQIQSLELAHTQQCVVDASAWQPGIYIVRVLSGGEHHYARVIKQ